MKKSTSIQVFAVSLAVAVLSSFFIVDVYNAVRPMMLAEQGQECLDELAGKDVLFTPLGPIEQKQCAVKNAVRIEKFASTTLNHPITVSCDFGLKLQSYFAKLRTKEVQHFGALNCRQVRGGQILSEHSFGNAIDITDFDNANVARDWNKDSRKGALLRVAEDLACNIFSNVLSPDSDLQHSNHIHLDAGPGFGC